MSLLAAHLGKIAKPVSALTMSSATIRPEGRLVEAELNSDPGLGRRSQMKSNEFDSAFEAEIAEIGNNHYGDCKPRIKERRARFHHAIRTIMPYDDVLDDDAIADQVGEDHGDDGLDFVFKNPEDGRLVCVQVKDSAKLGLAQQRDILKVLMGGVKTLKQRKSGGGLSETRREQFKLIRDHGSNPIEYTLILTGEAKAQKQENIEKSLSIDPDARLRVLDRRGLYAQWQAIRNPPPCEVKLSLEKSKILTNGPHASPRVVMGWISCTAFVHATKSHGNPLFRINPRLFLGGSRPNKSMLKTLADGATGAQSFHLFNNGLTACCDSISTVKESGNSIELEFSNFQIVNGCQTTVTLWNVWENSPLQLNGAWISIRVIEGDTALGRRVSSCTNSQSAITDADQRANDECQRRIKSQFETAVEDPIFYEARRGEWNACSQTQKRKFKRQLIGKKESVEARISMKELAQALLSVTGNPSRAKEQIVGIFKEDDATYKDLFENSWNDSAQLLLVADLFRYVSGIANWIDAETDEEGRKIARLGRFILTHAAYEYLKHLDGSKMFAKPWVLMDASKSKSFRANFSKTLEPVLQESLAGLTKVIEKMGGDIRSTLRGQESLQGIRDEIRDKVMALERTQRRGKKHQA